MDLMQPLSEDEFDQVLADADGLVLVDFWANWCGPCGCVGPALEELAPEYADRVAFYKVDADENRNLMACFGIRSIPTVLLLSPREGGADVVGQRVGSGTAVDYRTMIDRVLNPPPGLMERIRGFLGGA